MRVLVGLLLLAQARLLAPLQRQLHLFELRVRALQRAACQGVLPACLAVARYRTLELRGQRFSALSLRILPGEAALPLGGGNATPFQALVFGAAGQLRLAELVEQGLPCPGLGRCRLLLGPATAYEPRLFAVTGALAHVLQRLEWRARLHA